MLDSVGRRLLNLRIRAVLPHVQGRLLDVGCGTNQLVKQYGNGTGVDVHPWPGVDLVVPDSAQLPFEDASFDTITIVAALNHIPAREKVLVECARLLRPQGRLLVTMITPKISRVWHAIRAPWDADQHERGMEHDEVFGFYPGELISLVNGGGFRHLWTRRFMLGWNRLYAFAKQLPVT